MSQPEPIRVYVARHGERQDFVDPSWKETAENPHDPPLTKDGEEQASELGARLAKCNIAHVFASPFLRTVKTAVNAAAQLEGKPRVKIEPGICEWLSNRWFEEPGPRWNDANKHETTFGAIDATYEPVFPNDTSIVRFPESHEDMMARCKQTAVALIEKYGKDGNLLFVGHGASVEGVVKSLDESSRPYSITCRFASCCSRMPLGTPFHTRFRIG